MPLIHFVAMGLPERTAEFVERSRNHAEVRLTAYDSDNLLSGDDSDMNVMQSPNEDPNTNGIIPSNIVSIWLKLSCRSSRQIQ